MAVKMKNGKMYLTVVERMDLLKKEVNREFYSLNTDTILKDGVVIVKATLSIKHDNEPDSVQNYTGHALGELGKHKTLEATETHAIGRALASAGWHGGEFASANEMESYEKNQVRSQSNQSSKTSKPKPNTNTDDIVYVCNFGKKHNGEEWKDIPQDYVEWVAEKSKVEWQREEANDELARRGLDRFDKKKMKH